MGAVRSTDRYQAREVSLAHPLTRRSHGTQNTQSGRFGGSPGGQGANRREGTQTLRAEGAGAWNPRVNRTCRAGMCRRGQNSTRAVLAWAGSNRSRERGPRNEKLQGRAKRKTAAHVRGSVRGAGDRKDPRADSNRAGGAQNQICATGTASWIWPIRSRRTRLSVTCTPHLSQITPR